MATQHLRSLGRARQRSGRGEGDARRGYDFTRRLYNQPVSQPTAAPLIRA